MLRDGVDGIEGEPVIGIPRIAGAFRALRDPGRPHSARLTPLQTDDRDCAALVWLLRQGAGRPAADAALDALLATVRYRASSSPPAFISPRP